MPGRMADRDIHEKAVPAPSAIEPAAQAAKLCAKTSRETCDLYGLQSSCSREEPRRPTHGPHGRALRRFQVRPPKNGVREAAVRRISSPSMRDDRIAIKSPSSRPRDQTAVILPSSPLMLGQDRPFRLQHMSCIRFTTRMRSLCPRTDIVRTGDCSNGSALCGDAISQHIQPELLDRIQAGSLGDQNPLHVLPILCSLFIFLLHRS